MLPSTELEEIAILAQVVGESAGLDAAIGPVLRLLSERMGLSRATLASLERPDGRICILGAHGMTPTELQRVRFKKGEGLMGRVLLTGEGVRSARVLEDPSYFDWMGIRRLGVDPSFCCAAIRSSHGVIGALGGYRLSSGPESMERDLLILRIVGGLLAPHILAWQESRPQSGASLESAGLFQPSNLIGNSKKMRMLYDLVLQVGASPTTVLLRGESGTGKELVAQAIHSQSTRASGPFVKVNCAALPESIIESELFGHERGAFTGAVQQRKGRFERARKGTLFLDEIGDLSPSTQVKLLRVLQEREFERVGGSQPVKADIRVIAATSRDLEQMIAEGGYRSDLYYRLNVFPIWMPPLRERRADILLLADHFIQLFNQAHGKLVRRISTSAIDMLMSYHWPGNVRELENCMERAVLLSREDVIMGHHLPPTLQTAEASGTTSEGGLRERVEEFEREIVLDALKSARGNMARAARKLKISERIMGLRVRKYGIEPRRHRQWPT
jgi:Nif-specific regulatory protein